MAPTPFDSTTMLALDAFAAVGDVRARRMFGGVGISCDGIMFAMVADEVLYLKVDDTNRQEFEAEQCDPFTYERDGKRMAMSYYEAPATALDDPAVLAAWGERSLSIARAAKRPKSRR